MGWSFRVCYEKSSVQTNVQVPNSAQQGVWQQQSTTHKQELVCQKKTLEIRSLPLWSTAEQGNSLVAGLMSGSELYQVARLDQEAQCVQDGPREARWPPPSCLSLKRSGSTRRTTTKPSYSQPDLAQHDPYFHEWNYQQKCLFFKQKSVAPIPPPTKNTRQLVKASQMSWFVYRF